MALNDAQHEYVRARLRLEERECPFCEGALEPTRNVEHFGAFTLPGYTECVGTTCVSCGFVALFVLDVLAPGWRDL